jgi:DNA-binding transcriptional regulator YiaG
MSEIKALRQAMKASGTNTAEAARALGVSWQTVHRWISGRNEPSPVIRRLLRAEIERMKAGGK